MGGRKEGSKVRISLERNEDENKDIRKAWRQLSDGKFQTSTPRKQETSIINYS